MEEIKTIKGIRLAKEISQSEMAVSLGVHVNTYVNWEKNPSKIPVSKAIAICDRLGVSIDRDFFCL